MSRKRTVLHSQERHRSRKYKRRIRNLIIEILFISLLVFVAIKSIKNDDKTPTVSQLGTEEQKQLINTEMQEIPQQNTTDSQQVTKELQLPEVKQEGIAMLKATMQVTENQKQTIITIEVMNFGEEANSTKIPINFVDDEGNILEETYANIQRLQPKEKIKVNIVCEKNLNEATKIELRDERVY